MKKIAIIMPAYNCIETISRAIESVLNQSFTNWHLYIVNDCSTDKSSEIISSYASNKKISVIENSENLGAAKSRNVGLECGDEEFVTFLDSDDEWHQDKLKLQYQSLIEGSDFIISSYNYIKSNGLFKKISYDKESLSKSSFLKKKFRVCFSSLCFRRCSTRFKNIGHEDFIFLNELFDLYSDAKVLKEPLVNYYSVSGSLSDNKKRAAKWHLDCLKYLFDKKISIYYYFFYYVFNALIFKWKVK